MTDQTSRLSVVIDPRNAETAIQRLRESLKGLGREGLNLGTALQQMSSENHFKGLNQSINSTQNSLNAFSRTVANSNSTIGAFGIALENMRKHTTGISNSLNSAQASMARFAQSSQSVVSALNAINGANSGGNVNGLNNVIKQLNPNVTALNNELKKANTALNSFSTSANKAETAATRLNASLISNRTNMTGFASSTNGVGTALQRIGQSTASLQTQITGMGASIAALNRNLQTLNSSSSTASRGMTNIQSSMNATSATANTLQGTFSRLQGLMAGGFAGISALSIAKTADEMQNLDNQVRLVTKSTEERIAIESRLKEIANKNFADIGATTSSYQRNAMALAQLGKTQNDVLNFTDTLNLAMRTSGRSALEQKSAIYQLSQAMGSGKLQGDEFRSVSENMPAILKYIAKEMGVTTGALKELGSEGKVTSEVMYNALTKAKPELEAMAKTLPLTMGQAWTVFTNNVKIGVGGFMNGTGGISQGVVSILQVVGNNVGAFANILGGVAVVALARYVGGMASAQLATFGFNSASLIATATTARANLAFGAYSLGMNAIMVATRGAMLAQGALNLATTPLSATFARATASIRAGAGALLQWNTYANLASGANARLTGATLMIGGGFVKIASIINANPLMFLATVIFGIVASTEGLEGAMSSLGDAVGVVGIILSNFIKMGVDGFSSLLSSAGSFIGGFVNGTAEGANKGSANFGIFFEGTQKGFVGLLQGTASIFDAFLVTISTFVKKALNHVSNLAIGAKNAYLEVKEFLGFGDGNRVAYEETDFTALASESTFFSNGTRSMVDNAYAQQQLTKTTKNLTGASADLNKMLDPQAYKMYQQKKATDALAESKKALAKQEKENARQQKLSGNDLVSNTTLKGLSIKSGESTSGGKITRATSEFAKITQSVLGDGVKYFSSFNDSYHQGKGGQHPKGMAFDIALSGAKSATQAANEIEAAAKRYGYSVKLLNEYSNPSKNATGGHLHVSVYGKKDMGAGAFDVKQFDSLAKNQMVSLLDGEKDVLNRAMQHAMKYGYAELEKQNGLPKGLLTSMSMTESSAGVNMKSSAGALGEFQMMPATGKRFGLDSKADFMDTGKEAQAAAKYLKYLLERFGGDVKKAIMAYNAGEGNVDNGRAYKLKETQGHLAKNMRYMAVLNGGKNKDYSPNDILKLNQNAQDEEKKQLEEALKLRQEYGTKKMQIDAQVAEKIKKINENTVLPDTEKEAMRKQAQADGDRELAEYQKGLDDKLKALGQYKASELSIINKTRSDAIFQAEGEFKDNPEMLAKAKAEIDEKWRYDIDQYQAKMQKQRNELFAFQKTEKQVMVDGWADKIADAELATDELKDVRLEALKAESEQAIAIFDLEQSQKLLDLKKFNMTDMQYFEESLRIKQELVDKSNLSPEMKNAQKAQNEREAWGGRAENLKTANDNYMGMYFDLYGQKGKYDSYKSVEDKRTSQNDYAKQAMEQGIIQQQEYYQTLKDIDTQYIADKQAILSTGYGQTFGALAGIMQNFGMENSKAYKAMLFTQKVFALNTALLNAKVAISQAWATPGNWVTKALAVGKVVLQNNEIISGITAFSAKGFSTGGYTGDMARNAVAGVVHGKEYVVNAANTAKYRDKLESMNRGTYKEGGNIQVNNYAGAKIETRQENGLTIFDVRNEIESQMKSQMTNPNSTISKSIYRNTTTRPNR